MIRARSFSSMAACIAAALLPLAAAASDAGRQPDISIEGLVRDVACPIQNHESTATSFSMKCAVACARKGSPLIILTKAGDIYFPISDKMPDPSQRRMLMPYVGKYVHASGQIFERNGTHAIAISAIREMKDVHLESKGE